MTVTSQTKPDQSVFIAHARKNAPEAIQLVSAHLIETGTISRDLSIKIALPLSGQLLGVLHDLGKYSTAFQEYIQCCLAFDEDEEVHLSAQGRPLRGSVDHSTAGAQWVYQHLHGFGRKGQGEICAQILALCIASHHSGLIDCITPDAQNNFQQK